MKTTSKISGVSVPLGESSTAQHLSDFTRREDALLKRLYAADGILSERLAQWRLWIQDSAIYLHELRSFVEDLEQENKRDSGYELRVSVAQSNLEDAQRLGNAELIRSRAVELESARNSVRSE